MQDCLPPDKSWFTGLHVFFDLAFLGFKNKYNYENASIPHKKQKNGALTKQQKEENKKMASKRVIVEQAIGGMKWYRIVSERLRLHDFDFYNTILGVCAGLWNFYLLLS